MSNEPLFLIPCFQERIWGGTALHDVFHYDIPSSKTGECWAISAHPNGLSRIANGKYKGMSLQQLWEADRSLFGNIQGEKFPLLTKILDANQNLSIQVHPNDEYAKTNENGEFGKEECWYVIDCEEGAELIYGHNAKTKEELQNMIATGRWDAFLRKVSIKPGDFFYVPSGTVHALGKGTLILETQQSSDTTYRVYDYDRMENGKKRELHLQKAMDVITVPFEDCRQTTYQTERKEGITITTFVKSAFFTVSKWEVRGKTDYYQDEPFLLVSVLTGDGMLGKDDKQYPLKKGDHFILPNQFGEFIVEGNMDLIVAQI